MAFQTFTPQAMPALEVYHLMTATIIPRPIAFVSTQNQAGLGNLAPFSYFNAVAASPATLMFVVSATKDGHEKDTLRNCKDTGEFVVNSSHEWFFDKLVQSAAEYPYGVNELKEVGLTAEPSHKVKPFRVKESAVQFECKVSQYVAIGDGQPGSSTVVFGEIVCLHVSDEVMQGGRVDPNLFKPLARLGGSAYTTLGDVIDKTVPKKNELKW